MLENGNADLYLRCIIENTVTFGSVSLSAINATTYGNPALVKFLSSNGNCVWAINTGYTSSGTIFKHPGGGIGVLSNDSGEKFQIKEFNSSGVQTSSTVATNVTSTSISAGIVGYSGGFAYYHNLRGSYDIGGISVTSSQVPNSHYRDIGLVRYTAPPPPPRAPSAPLSVTGVAEQGIKVYPNPARHSLRIEGAEALGIVKVSDISGRLVLAVEAVSNSTELNLSDLPAGIYLVKAEHWSQPVKIQKL